MRKKLIYFTSAILLLIVASNAGCFKQKINSSFTTYQVEEVINNPRKFENLQTFHVVGKVEKGWSMPALFKVFPLRDTSTNNLILVIPNSKSLPRPIRTPQEFKVEVYAEPQLFGDEYLIVKEVD